MKVHSKREEKSQSLKRLIMFTILLMAVAALCIPIVGIGARKEARQAQQYAVQVATATNGFEFLAMATVANSLSVPTINGGSIELATGGTLARVYGNTERQLRASADISPEKFILEYAAPGKNEVVVLTREQYAQALVPQP